MKLLAPEIIGKLPPAIIPRLLALFGGTTPGLLADIRLHASNGNLPALAKAAHKLKGSCVSLGAEQMGDICRELQHKGETNDQNGVSGLVAQLEALYPATLAAMQAL